MDDGFLRSLNFVAVDVETANPNMASICQIGIAVVEGGVVTDEWQTLVNPQAWFDPRCVAVHGIEERDVQGAPTFTEIAETVAGLFTGRVVVSHTGFDRTAITRAFAAVPAALDGFAWLDSSVVVRRVWPQFSKSGYGLGNVADFLGIDFRHHDALEDAKTAAKVVVRAAEQAGASLEVLQGLVRRMPYQGVRSKNPEPNEHGPLYGERVVFTGSLAIPRAEAKLMAAELGCEIKSGVTKETTMLVVGDQDISRLAGKEKSEKHLKAEGLIEKGLSIRILAESDFFAMVEAEATA